MTIKDLLSLFIAAVLLAYVLVETVLFIVYCSGKIEDKIKGGSPKDKGFRIKA